MSKIDVPLDALDGFRQHFVSGNLGALECSISRAIEVVGVDDAIYRVALLRQATNVPRKVGGRLL